MRPPALGWLLVIFGQLCVLAVGWAAIEHRQARRKVAAVEDVMASLAAKRCVVVDSGASIRVYPPRLDTLKRASRP